MITHLLLDCDGVANRTHQFSDLLESEYSITKEQTLPFFQGPFADCLLGRADMMDLLPPYLEEWGWPSTPEEFTKRWFEYENDPNGEVLEEVARLRAGGVSPSLATNNEAHRVQYIREEMGFGQLFDNIFASSAIGYKKPEPDSSRQSSPHWTSPPANFSSGTTSRPQSRQPSPSASRPPSSSPRRSSRPTWNGHLLNPRLQLWPGPAAS